MAHPYEQAHPYEHGHPYPVAYLPPEPTRLNRWTTRLAARAPRWAAPVAILACFASACAYVLVTDPADANPDAVPGCLLRLTTGFDCPGCGGTRAMWYLLHGNLPAAARHHLLFVFALPFLGYAYVAWAGKAAFGWRLPAPRLNARAVGALLACWMFFSVARNLPWAPFTSFYV